MVQPSIWQSIIPKALRGRSDQSSKVAPQKKSNPANYFIWIYILIGSQAIRILQVKNEHTTFMRKADLQLAKLREVIEKLQRGEEVDVEKILGTGDEVQEQAWEDALREIETEERLWQTNKEQQREASKRALEDKQDANPVNEDDKYKTSGVESAYKTSGVESAVYTNPRPQAPGFY